MSESSMTRMCGAGAAAAIGCDADRVSRFEQRVRVENELWISLSVEHRAGEHELRGPQQPAADADDLAGVNHAGSLRLREARRPA